ncbi:restriction endonuclease subunit S [Oceanobacillus sp. CAU 1775]
MMEVKSLVPKRRFKEFKEVWKTVRIKDCIYYIKGFAFKSRYYQKEGIRIIRVSDLGTNEIMDNNEKIFIDRVYQMKYESYKLNLGDIIITTVGSKAELKESAVGRPILVKRKKQGLLNQNLVKLSPINGYNSYFIYGNLLKRRYVDYIRSIERGNANQANITINDLWEYNINHGSTIEQQKIGEFFKVLDERIANQERKIAKVRALKSAYLTEMFPQEGETVPKRRFKGFGENWNKVILGEMLSYEQPTIYIVSSEKYNDRFVTPVLTAGQSFVLGYTQELHGVKKASSENPVIIFDDFTTSSHFVNFSFKVKSSALKILIPNLTSFNSYFVYLALKNIQYVPQNHERHWISIFSKFEVLVPSIKEQEKIGQFFKNLDGQIATEEIKLDKLKRIKEAYLEEMFV